MLQNTKKLLAGVVALAALAVGGAAIADAASPSPTTTATATAPSASSSGSQAAPPAFNNMPAPGTAAHEDAEKAVTGTSAEKAQAAAVKAAGGGTAGAVTTDYFGTGYEVTVTKSDGSSVEVHLDSSFNAMQGPGGVHR
jgi:hypothetical protein